MLQTAFAHPGPAMVRYPRGTGPGVEPREGLEVLPIGEAEVRRRGQGLALLAFGSMLSPALEAGEALDATVINMRFVKPLDEDLILELAETYHLLVTVEENAVAGGAGSAVAEVLDAHGRAVPCLHLGLPDRFLDHASHPEQLAECGLDAAGIAASVRAALHDLGPSPVREGAAKG
jgi:1-deoxy-D-xylulose-5-phosphate synthase